MRASCGEWWREGERDRQQVPSVHMLTYLPVIYFFIKTSFADQFLMLKCIELAAQKGSVTIIIK